MELDKSLNQLTVERMNLLLRIGEEAHRLVRREEMIASDRLMELSESLKSVDIEIGRLNGALEEHAGQCPQCGKALESNAAYCTGCGFAVRDYIEQQAKTCGACGVRVLEKQIYCEVCGTKLK